MNDQPTKADNDAVETPVAQEQQEQTAVESPKEFVSRDFLVKAGILPKDDQQETAQAQGESPGQQAENEPVPAPSGNVLSADKPAADTDDKPQPQQKDVGRKIAKGYKKTESIAKAAAMAAVEAMNMANMKQLAAQQQPAQPQKQAQEDEVNDILSRLDDEQKKLLATFENVEKNNPAKYKNLKQNAIKALAEWERQKKEWAEQNPGKDADADFDNDGSVMAAIEEKYGLDVDEQDMIEAGVKAQIDPVKAELEKTRRELEEAKAILAAERAREQMKKTAEEAEKYIMQSLGIKAEEARKIVESNTLVSEAVKREMEAVNNFIEAAYTSFAGLTHPLTNQVAELCQKYEEALLAMPQDEQRDDKGRKFISRSAYLELPMQEQIMIDGGTHPKYWGMNAELASVLGANIIADRAKRAFSEAVEKENKILQEYGIKPQRNYIMQNQDKPRQKPPAPQPQPQPRRPASPTSVSPVQGHAPSESQLNVPQSFLQRFLGKEPIGGGVTYEIEK